MAWWASPRSGDGHRAQRGSLGLHSYPGDPGRRRAHRAPTSANIPLGESLQFVATTRDAGGAVLTGRPVSWSGGSAGFDGGLLVEAGGLVRSVRAGTGTVEAQAEQRSVSLPVRVVMDGALGALAAGSDHTCGLTGGGQVYCRGNDVVGQLGLAAEGQPGLAVRLTTNQTFAAVASRSLHTCALTVAGAAWCWGANAAGQLGRGSSDLNPHPDPAQVTGGHAFTSLALGDRTACGLTAAARPGAGATTSAATSAWAPRTPPRTPTRCTRPPRSPSPRSP